MSTTTGVTSERLKALHERAVFLKVTPIAETAAPELRSVQFLVPGTTSES
jgi:hypothetical protein